VACELYWRTYNFLWVTHQSGTSDTVKVLLHRFKLKKGKVSQERVFHSWLTFLPIIACTIFPFDLDARQYRVQPTASPPLLRTHQIPCRHHASNLAPVDDTFVPYCQALRG
jgi:hypothetical protein